MLTQSDPFDLTLRPSVLCQVSQLTTRLEQLLASQSIKLGPGSTAASAGMSTSARAGQGGEEMAALSQEEQRQTDDLARVRRRREQLERELRELEQQVDMAVSLGCRAHQIQVRLTISPTASSKNKQQAASVAAA